MVPSIEQITADEQGQLVDQQTIKRGDVIREVQATLVMTPETATSLGKWLLGHGKKAYEARQKLDPPG